MGFVKKISAFAAGLILAGALCGCGNPADNFAPKEFKKISPENAGYVLYGPDSWTADISTGVTTAYVSAKDRSNTSMPNSTSCGSAQAKTYMFPKTGR